jgi:hypothetical protein
VAAALVDNNASWYQRHIAAITAQMKKRVKPFEDAMARANLPRGFATDSYLIGFDNGRDEGKAEGLAAGNAEAVLTILKARGLPVTAAQRAKVLPRCDTSHGPR